jgi:DNA-binding response OmpR family regulator
MKLRLLLVEDNTDLRESLETYLEAEGFIVHAAGSAEQAEKLTVQHEFAAGIIDINLPGKSGFDFIKSMRNDGYSQPLIALTARDGITDKVRGFELGLTDYVVKPFSLAELAARLRAHLRDSSTQQQTISSSHIELLPERREAIVDGSNIALTGTEYRLLEALVTHKRQIVPTDDLIAHAWGEADRYGDPPVRIHMRNIRKKIHDDIHKRIRTIAGTGYMLDD